MIRNLTTLGQALRMAFMAGAGYQKGEALKKEDLDRWAKADISGGLLDKLERVCTTHDALIDELKTARSILVDLEGWRTDAENIKSIDEVIAKAEGRA